MAKNRIGNYYVDPLHIRIGINSEDEDGSIGPEVRLKMEIVQKWRGLKCRLEKCRGK